MSMSLRVIVPPHPIIGHWLAMLRNPSTPKALYGTGLEQLGKWLTYEALRDWLPNRKEEILTSNGKAEGIVIESKIPILSVPNIPGGIQMWQGARDVLPNATLCLGGVPTEIEDNSGIIFYLDQITTGSQLIKDIDYLQELEIDPQRIRVITSLASSIGLKNIGERFKDLNIFCACIDPELLTEDEMSPGIGNPTLRINTRVRGRN